MSYYILPKNINTINVSPESCKNKPTPYISFSLLNYYNILSSQIIEIFNNDFSNNSIMYSESLKIVNPYEFIFSKVPGSKYSVSKLKGNTNLFYDLIEIISNLNIFYDFRDKNINILNISPNNNDMFECINIFREDYNDTHELHHDLNIDLNFDKKFNFVFYETNCDPNEYFLSILKVLVIIFKSQSFGGTLIFKIKDIFYKPIVDLFYIISSLYDKVYISKPSTNNVTTFEKYIVCKNFLLDENNNNNNNYLRSNYFRLIVFIKRLEGKYIKQIINYDVPYYFKTKLSDLNIIIGQQQVEALDQIISIYKSKNKDDKIEFIKKSNIQKSVSWCEKYKIPCNKFTEKINIFLPITNEIT
jgi:hypothetical protein